MVNVCDEIYFKIPLKSQYVNIIRLSVSGICARMGFDIDTIEDIKVSVTEVYNKMLSFSSDNTDNCEIKYLVSEKNIEILFGCENKIISDKFKDIKDDIGFIIMSAFMDNIELVENSKFILKMCKSLDCNEEV